MAILQSSILTAYSPTWANLGEVDYIEVQWNRKWYECGMFSVYMAAKDWNKNYKYFRLNGRPERGVVLKVEYEQSNNGDFVTLSGLFLQGLLNWKCSAKNRLITSTSVLEDYLVNVAQPVANPEATGTGEHTGATFWDFGYDPGWLPNKTGLTTVVEAGTGLCDALYSVLKSDFAGYSFYAAQHVSDCPFTASYTWVGLYLYGLRGYDRSGTIVFKKSNGNCSKIEYKKDESACKNLARVGLDSEISMSGWFDEYYAGEGAASSDTPANRAIKQYYDSGNTPGDFGKVRPEFYIAGNTTNEIKSDAITAIGNELAESGKLEMLNRWKDESVSIEAVQIPGCEYLTNYTIGDKVAAEIDELQISYTNRITEVSEVHKANHCEITLTLGEPSKKMWRKI